ncbi:MAG: pyridoxamine 5'-phosphate oxidase family protein [Xanthobacteraceae bacterium]|jgi:Pyridoxamine 5'-phosphate oxidase
MPLSDTIKTLIRNAWDDGCPCLVGTCGPAGPNISVKGSMVVFDDGHLAYWERSKRTALENLAHDKRVCVMYSNFKAQRDGVLESGFLRFFGTVELHESGPVHDAIFAKLLPREQTHVGADTGIGALVKIEHAIDIRGKPIML